MKNKLKTKTQEIAVIATLSLLLFFGLISGLIGTLNLIEKGSYKSARASVNTGEQIWKFIATFLNGGVEDYAWTISVPKTKAEEKTYAYNEQVPESVILNEMHILAKRFNINDAKWEKLLRCEATCVADYCERGKLDNLAINKLSTATGIGQYLIGTWQETESWKQNRCARTDYKCALWEMALDLSQGESWRWKECLDIKGIKF